MKEGGSSTNWEGQHDGGVVGWSGRSPLSENALSGWVYLKICTKWSKFALSGQNFRKFAEFYGKIENFGKISDNFHIFFLDSPLDQSPQTKFLLMIYQSGRTKLINYNKKL